MALIATYGCPSCRSVVEAMAATGNVWPMQASPVRGGGSPYSMSSGGNTYTFYSGPEGGPHPVFTGGLGYVGDLLAWNGYRCATDGVADAIHRSGSAVGSIGLLLRNALWGGYY